MVIRSHRRRTPVDPAGALMLLLALVEATLLALLFREALVLTALAGPR